MKLKQNISQTKISQGSHLEIYDFPYPKSLIKNNKYIGEIGMTLAYLPPLDQKYDREYCRTNIDVSFGTYSYKIVERLIIRDKFRLNRNGMKNLNQHE